MLWLVQKVTKKQDIINDVSHTFIDFTPVVAAQPSGIPINASSHQALFEQEVVTLQLCFPS